MSKSTIRQRMLREAAEVYQQYTNRDISSLDGFDPLVMMLINACADELSVLGEAVRASQERMLTHLAQLLTPTAYLGPVPAHGLLHATSLSSDGLTDKYKDEFSYNSPTGRALHFTPAGNYPLINGKVRLWVQGNVCTGLTNGTDKEVLLRTTSPLPVGVTWLGLQVDPSSLERRSLNFYFDIPFEQDRNRFEELLSTSSWNLAGCPLEVRPGIVSEDSNDEQAELAQFHLVRSHEQDIQAYYQHRFLRVSCPQNQTFANFPLALYPEGLTDYFQDDELAQAVGAQPLLWLKIEFSPSGQMDERLLGELLNQLLVQINCFPIINRRFQRSPFLLNEKLNIFALKVRDSYFYGVETVKASKTGRHYTERPFSVLLDPAYNYASDNEMLAYAIRKEGVHRFDERSALEMMDNLLRIVREEISIYNALGGNVLTGNIKTIQKGINDIYAKLARKKEEDGFEQKVFLAFPAAQGSRAQQYVVVAYWSTNGLEGTNVPAGESFKLNETSREEFIGSSFRLLATTNGGRDTLPKKDHLNAFRNALLVRDKIVTEQDIKLYCQQAVGSDLKTVHVHKGVAIGKGSQEGLMRIIKISLQLHSDGLPAHRRYLEDKLTAELNSKSAGYLPIQVEII